MHVVLKCMYIMAVFGVQTDAATISRSMNGLFDLFDHAFRVADDNAPAISDKVFAVCRGGRSNDAIHRKKSSTQTQQSLFTLIVDSGPITSLSWCTGITLGGVR